MGNTVRGIHAKNWVVCAWTFECINLLWIILDASQLISHYLTSQSLSVTMTVAPSQILIYLSVFCAVRNEKLFFVCFLFSPSTSAGSQDGSVTDRTLREVVGSAFLREANDVRFPFNHFDSLHWHRINVGCASFSIISTTSITSFTLSLWIVTLPMKYT